MVTAEDVINVIRRETEAGEGSEGSASILQGTGGNTGGGSSSNSQTQTTPQEQTPAEINPWEETYQNTRDGTPPSNIRTIDTRQSGDFFGGNAPAADSPVWRGGSSSSRPSPRPEVNPWEEIYQKTKDGTPLSDEDKSNIQRFQRDKQVPKGATPDNLQVVTYKRGAKTITRLETKESAQRDLSWYDMIDIRFRGKLPGGLTRREAEQEREKQLVGLDVGSFIDKNKDRSFLGTAIFAPAKTEEEKAIKAMMRADVFSGVALATGTTAALTAPLPTSASLQSLGLSANAARAAQFGLGAARFGQGGLKLTVGAMAGQKGFEQIGYYNAPEEEQMIIRNERMFNEALRAGYAQETTKFKDQAWYKRYAQEIPVVPLFAGDEKAFVQGVQGYYKAAGFEGEKLDIAISAAIRQRRAGLIGEGAGVLIANVGSEILGRGFVSESFKKTAQIGKKEVGGTLFRKAFWQIGKAGFWEGAASEIVKEQSRKEEFNLKKVGFAAGFGFVSAGTIGGTIAGLRYSRPNISKLVEFGSYITDPYEKPGDIIAGQVIRSLDIPVSTPAIVDTAAREFILSPGKQGGQNVINVKQTAVKPITLTTVPPDNAGVTTQILDSIFTRTPTKSNNITGNVPTEVISNEIANVPVNIPVPATITTETTIGTPIQPQVPVDVPIQPNIPIDINMPTNITTNVPATVPTTIPVTIPTPVSRMLIPPPVPLSLGGFGRGVGFFKGKGKKYIDELAAGKALLGKLNTPNISLFAPQKKTKTSKTKTPKGKKRIKERRKPGFDFTDFIFSI